ncbi:MAG: XRE family transcriptional regulator [Clostridia bacterium]|nr:XRE family transcriptional regulator [Clostridia bacterium]MCI1999914.1 XRE family transcriptional regulator [Clostridia bacterium]MCI2014170.1 XRE family transcriptional regulator [Clostridia bacterium]
MKEFVIKFKLRDNISFLLNREGWTLSTLSKKSLVPYETIKKLCNAKIENPSIMNILKIAEAFDCSVDALVGRENALAEKIRRLPEHSIQIIDAVADFEERLIIKNYKNNLDKILVFVVTGKMEDRMIFDSTYFESVNVHEYKKIYGDRMFAGIKITSKVFYPAYGEGDILLLARDRYPAYGETGVFLKDGRMYIRKFYYGNPSILMPLNCIGVPIEIDNMKEWTIFGYVLTVVRQKME